MGYEALDLEFKGIKLGGIDKKTGKKNPTEVEGYYLGFEQRPNKFNPGKPQNFYKFQTKDGLVGVYGTSAGLVRAMRNAVEGRMTKLVDTGETLDTGKGNPMRVFKAWQDKNNTIDPNTVASAEDSNSSITASSSQDYEEYDSEEDDSSDEIAPPPVQAPRSPKRAADPSAALALLSKRNR